MKYDVVVTAKALAEIQSTYDWITERSIRNADRWLARLLATIHSLETIPERCVAAHEAAALDVDLRQLLHGKRQGTFRILFTIRGAQVIVLRVVHGAVRVESVD